MYKHRGSDYPYDNRMRWAHDSNIKRVERVEENSVQGDASSDVLDPHESCAISKDLHNRDLGDSYRARHGIPRYSQKWMSPAENEGLKHGSRVVQNEERHEDDEVVRVAGETIGISLYPRLMTILTVTEDLDPQRRSIGWVIRLMDEIYDSRRRADEASFAAEEDHFNLDGRMRRHTSFPTFAYNHLKNKHGVKHVVRSVCLDLVCNAHIHRRRHPEVEVFARFLEEFYGEKELYFFLDVRAQVQRMTRVCCRRQKTNTQTVWMSHADCVRVARGVFVDTTTLYFRDLIDTIESQMASATRPPNRKRISVSDFFYLAMVCFTSPEEPYDRHCADVGSRSGRPRSLEMTSRSHGGAGNRCGHGRNRSRGRVARPDIVAPKIDILSSEPIPGHGVYQQSYPRRKAGRNSGERRDANSPSAERGIAKCTEEVEDGVHQPRSHSLEREGSGRREPGVGYVGRNSNDCRGASDSNALHVDAIETGGTGGLRKAKIITSVSSDPKSSGVRLDAACEKELRSPTVTCAMSRSPTAVLHVETGFLGMEYPQAKISPGSRTGDGHSGTPVNQTAQSTRSPRDGISALDRDRTNGCKIGLEEKKYGTGHDESLIASRGINTLKRRDRDGEMTTRDAWFKSDANPGGKQTCEGEEKAKARTTAQGSRGEGMSGKPRESKVMGGDRTSSNDADLTSLGSKSNSTYMSAEDSEEYPRPKGGDGFSVGENVTGPTTDLRLNMLLSAGPPLPRPTRPLRPQQRSPRSTILADTTTHQMAAATFNDRRGVVSPTASRGRSSEDKCRGNGPLDCSSRHTRAPNRVSRCPPSGCHSIPAAVGDSYGRVGNGFERRGKQYMTARKLGSSSGDKSGMAIHDDSSEDSQAVEIREDVLSLTTDWFSAFELRFFPGLAAKLGVAAVVGGDGGEGHTPMAGGFAPLPISRILSEEMVRILALRRRDLHAVARDSPDLLHKAVAEACYMVDSAVSNASTHCLALCNMGRLLEGRGHPDEALLCFQEASSVHSSSAEAMCLRAANLRMKGNLEDAVFYFESALARDESHWPAWHGLGQTKAAQGMFTDAVEALSRWLEGDTTAAGVHKAAGLVQLGDAQKELGQDTHAQISYEQAAATDAGSSDAYFKLGTLLQARKGHEADALEAFRKAVNAAEARSSASSIYP